jgi:hypothetical protein
MRHFVQPQGGEKIPEALWITGGRLKRNKSSRNIYCGGKNKGEEMNVYQKLQAARIKLQNTELKKSGHNKFAGYQYFELGDFLPTIQKIFSEIGLCGTVSFLAETASLTIFNCDKPEEAIIFTSPMGSAALKGCHEVQNIGAVETYQRRYLWVTAMEIVEHDALDATTAKEPPQSKEAINKISKLAKHIEQKFAAGDEWAAFEAWDTRGLDADESVQLWGYLGSKTRSTIKSMKAEAEKQVTV